MSDQTELQDRKPCECGCGEYPKLPTSRFLPGHDLRKAYGSTTPVEQKVCPKCSDTLNRVDVPVALPQSTHEGVRFVSDTTPAISLSRVFPLGMYVCENCRFVELYAD
jgi:hypothetical protein